jgi:hypothetical protein
LAGKFICLFLFMYPCTSLNYISLGVQCFESKIHASGAAAARTQEIDRKGGYMPTGILFGQMAVVLGITFGGICTATL